jgi:hypothetical protein
VDGEREQLRVASGQQCRVFIGHSA